MNRRQVQPERKQRVGKRKNTYKWCRGRTGVPHQPVVVKQRWGHLPEAAQPKCSPIGTLVGWKNCWHRVECQVCGKYLGDLDPRKCPELEEHDESESSEG